MASHIGFRYPAILALMWWLVGFGIDISAEAPRTPDGIVITLKDKTAVTGRMVTLGDVADISGGSEHARLQIGRLDLAEFGSASSVNIRRRQVEFRLRLANFPAKLFTVNGAEEITVAAIRVPISEEGVFRVAKDSVLKRLPWSAEDLSIKLVQPITARLPVVADDVEVVIKAEPHTPNVNIGRVQMDVTIFVSGEKKLALPVYLEIKLTQPMAIARSGLNRGDTISEVNTLIDRRVVDIGMKPLSASDMVGRKIRRPVAIGQVIQETDVEPTVLEIPKTAVKNHQPVKMLVRLGTVNVVANGEALQDGKEIGRAHV